MSENWVFGGSKPLGLAICDTLLSCGKVLSFSRSTSDNADGRQESIAVDFNDAKATTQIFRERLPSVGPLGAVFCQRYRPNDNIEDIDAIKRGLDVELSPLLALLAEHKKSQHKYPLSIVLISSVAGKAAHPDVPLWYHILKAVTLQATKVLAARYAAEGTRVNCIVLGEFEKYAREDYTDKEREKFDNLEKHTLSGRICRKSDVARLTKFLLSDDASYISGQVITLDGTLSEVSQEAIIRTALQEHGK